VQSLEILWCNVSFYLQVFSNTRLLDFLPIAVCYDLLCSCFQKKTVEARRKPDKNILHDRRAGEILRLSDFAVGTTG